jgi:hypothetical protein
MNQREIENLLRSQARRQLDLSISKEQLLLVPVCGPSERRLACAYVAVVADKQGQHVLVQLSYSSNGKGEDLYELSRGNAFLQGTFSFQRSGYARISCELVTEKALKPFVPPLENFQQLRALHDRLGKQLDRLFPSVLANSDLLGQTTAIEAVQDIVRGLTAGAQRMDIPGGNSELRSLPEAQQALVQAMLSNFNTYAECQFSESPWERREQVRHGKVDRYTQHMLWALASTDVLTQLKRRFRQANEFLLGSN